MDRLKRWRPPIVLYDVNADRYVASQFAIERPNGKSYQLVAISATGDPLGEYYRYAFEFDHFNDYPKMSTWHDGYYCTFNFFESGFIGSGVAAFERDKMLVGDPDAGMIFSAIFQTNLVCCQVMQKALCRRQAPQLYCHHERLRQQTI